MVTINKLEIENVKRVKAVKLEPSATGLTIVGGNNNQGKTSVLDAIAWALGGNKYKPSQAQREGSTIPPSLKITLSNGLIVERSGKNSTLKVIDPSGNKAGQNLLDSFVEELAINLPKFMEQTSKEKAKTLLQIIGVGPQLAELEMQEKAKYDERHAIGVIADQKEKFAKEQPYYPDAPKELVSISELIQQQQEILGRNGENARKRQNLTRIENEYQGALADVERLSKMLEEAREKEQGLAQDLDIARKDTQELIDESTQEIEDSIANIEQINLKVRANFDKDKAEEDAKGYREQYKELDNVIAEGEPTADLIVRTQALQGTAITSEDIPTAVDEIPMLVLAATQALGDTLITGAQELHVKETDRIATVTTQLNKLGANIEAREDGFLVNGGTPLHVEEPTVVDSSGDHRIGMMLAIAALLTDGEVALANADSVSVSYPSFFADLERLVED